MHVNPFVAMRFFFLPAACGTLMNAYIVTSLSMHMSTLCYVATLSHLLHVVVFLAMACAMFRLGPQAVLHRMYQVAMVCMAVLAWPMWYLGYIGPQQTVPWNNRLQFLVVSSLSIAFVHLAAAAGGIPGEHPVEPRISIMRPVFRAVIQTLRVTDSLTDLSLIGELLTDVRF